MNIKILSGIFVATALFGALLSSPVNAQYGAYGQYTGGGPAQTIMVQKLVGKPVATTKGGTSELQYVDNLSLSDVHFQPGQSVFFRITVKNTSNVTLPAVMLTDSVPGYVEPMDGPGNYDAQNRVISVNVGDLAPGEERTYNLRMQVVGQNSLPADKNVMCLTNTAKATSGSASDTSSSQFCVEKQVTGVTGQPAAGPEMGPLLLAGETLLLGAGVFLRKKFA